VEVGVRAALALASLLVVTGCEDSIWGPPTESTCPEDSQLTYENFGQPFMTKYCTRCHDSAKTGAARHGAPSFHDFDTLFGVLAVADHIDETAAAGPAAVNEGMPEDGLKPTSIERRRLGEWLACEQQRESDTSVR
jgi:hypothetical protein